MEGNLFGDSLFANVIEECDEIQGGHILLSSREPGINQIQKDNNHEEL